MKYIKLNIVLVAVTLLFFGNAYSADVRFDIASDYVVGDSSITFALNLITDTEVQVQGWQLNFDYDENELFFTSYENHGRTLFSSDYRTYDGMFKNDTKKGELKSFIVYAESYVCPDWETLEAKTTTLGTFTFDVIDGAALDENSDFFMLNPNMISIKEGGNTLSVNINPALTHMTDAGSSPVPVPAAVWLLGSGLVGLAGLRRKTA